MPPKQNPLPELIPNRVMYLRDLLRASLWENKTPLSVAISPILEKPVSYEQAAGLSFVPIQPGQHFGEPFGAWQQAWFRVDVPAPQPGQTGRRYFFWDCRGETVAYIDGQPWAGLDVAHGYCVLPDRAVTLWLDCGTYQTCMWAPDSKEIDQYGLLFEGAWTACRNLKNWEVFFDLDVLAEYLKMLLKRDGLENMVRMWGPFPAADRAHPVLRQLLDMLDEAWMAWEIGGVEALAPALKRIYAALPAESWQPKVTMVGHSHLDLVWMWPEIEGNRKAIHTIATAQRLLDEYPQYRFMWTSPHMMKLVEERFPQMYQDIKQRIKDGRWEATGAPWVEFDTLIATGEALGRSLVLGQKRFLELRGQLATTVWLPDCFGFNGFLPQIMALAGVKNFFTSKLSWSSQTRFPYDSFIWRSADGSEVLTHLDVTSQRYTLLDHLADSAQVYRQLAANHEYLKSIGVGDGGGGTMVNDLERINRLSNLAQIPPAQWGSVEDFFDRLEQSRQKLPVYEGELYLEFHRGIYTTQSEFKRRYRQLERALQTWEATRVLSGGGPIPDHPWERLSFAQFHDALPGSSIKLVYDTLGANLEDEASGAMQHACEEAASALAKACGVGTTPVVFNPLALARRVVVELPAGTQVSAPSQTVSTPKGKKTIASLNLPGFGISPIADDLDTTWQVSPRLLDNGVLRVEFDEQGQITRASDSRSGAWPLVSPPHFRLHPDYPPTFDAWEIDHIATRQTIALISGFPLRVVENGPVRAVLSGTVDTGSASRLEIRYILEAGANTLRIELDVDWQEDHRILRFYLPTSLRGKMAKFGAPFGTVARQQTPGMPREEAMWEVPASRWAAVTDDLGDHGLAILTEAKYGFAARDGELALTLLRASEDPAGPNEPQQNRPQGSTERGKHSLRFAIGHYNTFSTDGHLATPAQAESLYAPVLLANVKDPAQYLPLFSFQSDLKGIVPSWVLPTSDDGYVIRLHETAGTAGALTLAFQTPPASVASVDFLERPIHPECLQSTGPAQYQMSYKPYQVLSLKIKR